MVLQLPEPSSTIRFPSAEVILKSGDVHPQPGPTLNHHHNDVSENTRRVIYSSSQLIHYGKNISNPPIDQDLKFHLQNLGIWNSCNYISNSRTLHIKTITHSRRNSRITTSQRLTSAGSNINNCVVISPGKHANIQRVIPVRITERVQAFKRR